MGFIEENPKAITAILLVVIVVLTITTVYFATKDATQSFTDLPTPMPIPYPEIKRNPDRNKPAYDNLIPLYEANPMVQYADMLTQTGSMGSPMGSKLNMEEQRSILAEKQGVIDKSMQTQHKLYSDGMIGSWANPQNTVIETREITSPYHAFTRALRGSTIRSTESVVPDKQSQTLTPLVQLNALNIVPDTMIDPKKINY